MFAWYIRKHLITVCLKWDISPWHGVLSGKLSAALQAVKGRSVTTQELPHSKTAEANSKNSLSQAWTKAPANIREPYSVRRASFQIRLSSKVIRTLAIKWHFVLTLIPVSWPRSSLSNNILPTQIPPEVSAGCNFHLLCCLPFRGS